MQNEKEKSVFAQRLKAFAVTLADRVSVDGKWTMRGFVDTFGNIYVLPADTKVVSKLMELHLFPYFARFAEETGYIIERPIFQNWYPNLTFVNRDNPEIKFAVDLKTTYRDESFPEFCNGFTLGSHGEYFVDRASRKNIQYPYNEYSGHFCLGIIYARLNMGLPEEPCIYAAGEIDKIPPVIGNFIFFAEEKWKIASDRSGSGNTANIGSIQKIDDILAGNGVFAKAGEELFDDYWINFGKIEIRNAAGRQKKMTSFPEYLRYRGLPESLNNPKASKRKG